MSAIAHGWHPSDLDIPVKVAKDFHAADTGHKYGKGMDKKAKAMRATKHYRRARGGSIEGDGKDDVSYGGTLPRQLQPMTTQIPDSWMRAPIPKYRYADGGDVDWSKLNQPFGELKGNSPQDTPVQFKTASPYVNITEGDIDRGMNIGMAAGPGIMVGPYGATALRNAARETGNVAAESAMVHPTVGKEIQAEVNKMHPDLRDAYRNGVQASRDEWARATLESRAAKGDFYDSDVFAKSGWSFTADGKPAKEIPDIGDSVKEHLVDKGGRSRDPKYVYSYEHPAGDLHKIYEIPPIEQDPTAIATGARAYMNFGRPGTPIGIGVGTNPTKAVGPVGHEVQHAIAYREDWPMGSSPRMVRGSDAAREYFPGEKLPEYQKDTFLKAEPSKALKAHIHDAPSTQRTAELMAYLHSAGENQSFNRDLRRRQSFRYLQHPAETELVPRALQDIEYFGDQFKKAGGGSVGNFNPERGAAIGLSRQGIIKSTVPGRTDKLNLNVPSGSYVIPADIPSALGQGNTTAGGAILDRMFNKGPYGMNLPRAKSGSRVGRRKASLSTQSFAEGGDVGQITPIIAAGGEYMVHPETVAGLGNGDMDLGHSILDSFVKQVRAKHINTLKNLKPPKGSS